MVERTAVRKAESTVAQTVAWMAAPTAVLSVEKTAASRAARKAVSWAV
jgi:hypothetical protein